MTCKTSRHWIPWVPCLVLFLASSLAAQDFSPAATRMFHELHQRPNELARYVYLIKETPKLSRADQQLAMQMFAAVENELGLYSEALHDFPLTSRIAADLTLPTAQQWKAADAVDVITSMAKDRRLVLINEAHHDAHTRQLTLALLPRLRALGFNYFAVEALSGSDDQLAARGYPVTSSGSEYLHEPCYGEIVRTALRLGFILVSYDVDSRSQQGREDGQARNLYQSVFANDPHARLFVHAGYAHIDKAKGRLGKIEPMAMRLQELTGIEPLSIDQTHFREQIPAQPDTYRRLVTIFPVDGPTVLVNRSTGTPWSAQPTLYDVNVLLPPTEVGFLESGLVPKTTNVHDGDSAFPILPDAFYMQRPDWLKQLHGRLPYRINSTLCRSTYPCVVDARYLNESDDAIAADRYTFTTSNTTSRLYLRPGRYRLHAQDARGHALAEQVIRIGQR